jgi:hypothetical protein
MAIISVKFIVRNGAAVGSDEKRRTRDSGGRINNKQQQQGSHHDAQRIAAQFVTIFISFL